jgi:hypothetical protein
MPNRDGTGPNGQGPATGRRMGACVSKKSLQEQEKFYEERLLEIRKMKESEN